jgi:hypothetical protein
VSIAGRKFYVCTHRSPILVQGDVLWHDARL